MKPFHNNMPLGIVNEKFILLFFALVPVCAGFSQNPLYGKVVDEITGQAVASASVYLSNTSVGTQTNTKGQFYFEIVPAGNFTLVVSCIGYKISETDLQTNKPSHELIIRLGPKTTELKEIVVTPYEEGGWKKWGDLFVENFIGTSFYARDCKIKNHEVLKFRMRHKDSTLVVYADAPLVIVNNSLGYELHFDLKDLELNFTDSGNSLTYSGHPFFKELVPKNVKEERRYEQNRRKAYSLSMMRFMRSLFSQKAEDSFKVQQKIFGNMTNVPLIRSRPNSSAFIPEANADTIYEIGSDIVNIRIIKLRNDHQGADLTNGENFTPAASAYKMGKVFTFTDQLISMYFDGSLLISIKNENSPSEYLNYLGNSYSPDSLISQFELKKNEPVQIYADGNYSESTNLKIKGFWAWWEKLATMLPLDYYPIQ